MVRRDRILIGILVVVVAAIFGFFIWLVGQSMDSESPCHQAGGVPLRGYCIDKDAIIEVGYAKSSTN